MHRLKMIKDQLIAMVATEMTHAETVCTKELGEVIDMIKDIEEAIYYCTITKAMEEKDEQKETHHYYTEPMPRLDSWSPHMEKTHHKKTSMKELENYLHELSKDIAGLIGDSTIEEQMTVKKKMNELADKIGWVSSEH